MLMNSYLHSVLRDTISCPFVPVIKQEPISLGAAAIGAAGSALASILSGIFGSSSNSSNIEAQERMNERNIAMQRETNKLNYQIAQEANSWNYRMMKEQNDWNLQQWNRVNAYNDPSSVVRRLRAAGLNPALQYGSPADAGQLTSAAASPASVAEMVAPHGQAALSDPSFIGMMVNGASNAVNAFQDSMIKSAAVNKTTADTQLGQQQYRQSEERFSSDLEYLQRMSKREDFLGEIARTELAYRQAVNGVNISLAYGNQRAQEQNLKLVSQQMFGQQLQNAMYQLQLAYLPKMNDAQITKYYTEVNQLKAQIGLINANTTLTKEQTNNEILKAYGTFLDNNAKGMDNDVKKRTLDYLVDMTKESLDKQRLENSVLNAEQHYGWPMTKMFGVPSWNLRDYLDSHRYNSPYSSGSGGVR